VTSLSLLQKDLTVAKFLVIFQWGDMARDPDTITEARQALTQWEAKTAPALIDAGTPIRSTATLSRDGASAGDAAAPPMGWSLIDAPDRNAAVQLLEDHPLLGLGAVLQINEPI
jgi:hypothetical protein